MKNPITDNGQAGTLDDLAKLTNRDVTTSDAWVKKINVWLFKRRKQTDVQ